MPAMAQDTFSLYWEPCDYAFTISEPIVFWIEDEEGVPWAEFDWDFGDASTARGWQVSHVYQNPGGHLLRVTGLSAAGEPGESFCVLLFVNPAGGNPDADAWITAPQDPNLVVRAGSRQEFRAGSSTADVTFHWQILGTPVVVEGEVFSWDVPADLDDRKFWVHLFGVNEDGMATAWPDARELYVFAENQPPETVLVSPPRPSDGVFRGNVGETLTFTASGEDPDGHVPVQLSWYISSPTGDFDAFGDTLTYQLSEAGWHGLGVWATDALEREDPFPVEFDILVKGENQTPEVWMEDEPRTLFVGEETTLHADGYDPDEDPITFSWDLGDGRTATGESVVVSYAQPGAYVVELTGEDIDGAVSPPYQQWIMVNPEESQIARQAPNPSIVEPMAGDMFPFGTPIVFRGHGWSPEPSPLTYYWGWDDGTVAQGQQVSRAFSPTRCEPDEPCVTWPYLFVRDAEGLFSWWNDAIPIALYSGDRPPNGVILSPQVSVPPDDPYGEPRFQLKPGELLHLSGRMEAPPQEGDRAWWTLLHHSDQHPYELVLQGFDPDPISFETFPEGGDYGVYLHVARGTGQIDPIPAFVDLWVRDTNVPPEVEIVEPGWDQALMVGDHLDLAACGYDEDGDAIEFHWQCSDGRTFQGERIDHVRFDQPGIHWIELTATDSEGAPAKAPYRAFVVVTPPFDPDLQYPPEVIGVSPEKDELIGAPGSQFFFSCRGLDYFEEPITEYFWDFGNGQTSNLAAPGQMQYVQPGLYLVRAFVKNTSQLWSWYPHIWVVYIYGSNIPPQGEITEPPLRDHEDSYLRHVVPVLINQSISLVGAASDPDGHLPLTMEWFLDGVFWSSSATPDPLTFSQRGEHDVELGVADNLELWDPYPDYRLIQVVDPALKPESYIACPDGNLTVEPGEEVYFFGFGEDPNNLELSFFWDFGPQASPMTARGEEVYPVIFDRESPAGQPYEVSFWTTTQFTQDDTPARLSITVRQYQDADFEPNNSLSEAPLIQKGTYSQLSLGANGSDEADYFRFRVDQDGRDMALRLAPASQQDFLVVELYRYDDGDWVAQSYGDQVVMRNTFTLENMPAGEYAIEVRLPDSEKNRRDGLSYGMGLNTLQPSLYLPFLVDDGNLVSSLGLLNPYDQDVDLAIAGLNERGQMIETKFISIPAHGRIMKTSADLFGTRNKVELAREIVWARVQATQRIIGFVMAESRDQSQLIGATGIASLVPSVIVPHIAARTDQWYTRAITINAQEKMPAMDFEADAILQEISGATSGIVQSDFRFSELFEELPAWGRFISRDREASLAGVEIFGRRDGAREMAGLEMIYEREGNPNFVHLESEIYFSHVAKDTANFWTGIALINLEASPATLQIVGVDDDGTERIRLSDVSLPAHGKILSTVSDLFGGVQEISWIRVLTTNKMAGFELFGDHQSTRLAGFQAAQFTSDQLFFPHVRVEENAYWTGIAVLNMGDAPVNLTIEGYDDQGNATGHATQILAPRTKLVRNAEALFPDGQLPPGTSHLVFRGDRNTLTGFELFGTLKPSGGLGDQLAGIQAQAL